MNQFLLKYSYTFNSLDVPQQIIFLFWSLCVVLFFSSVFMVIVIVTKEGITNLFKKKSRPQTF